MATKPQKIATSRGDGWQIQADWLDPTGTRRYRTRRIYPPGGHGPTGRSAARQALAELELEVARLHHHRTNSHELRHSMTVAELMQRWLEWRRPKWTERTFETTVGRVRLHILRDITDLGTPARDASSDRQLQALAQRVAADVTPQHIETHLELLATHGAVKRRGGLSRRSLERIHAHLSGAFSYAVYLGVRDTNPCSHGDLIPGRTTPADSITVPTPDQAAAAFAWEPDADRDLRWRALLRFLILTGCRRGEAVGLKWDDLHPDTAELHIRRAVSATKGELHVLPPKNQRTRHFVVDRAVVDEVKVWGEWTRGQFIDGARPEYVWWNRTRSGSAAHGVGPMHPDSADGWWDRVRGDLGCEGVRLHDWRHYNATMLLAAGVDPATVARRLGHSVDVLLRTYAHAVPARDHGAASVVADSLRR